MNVSLCAAGTLILAMATPVAFGENLLKNGSFEEPKVEGRMDATKGGSPALATGTIWARFQSRDETGRVSVGMTNELARSGQQSIYVEFNAAEKTKGAILLPQLIPIRGSRNYKLSLWGRVDRKRPLTLDQGRPYMLVEVEFYRDEEGTRLGETELRTQMIPGMANSLLFVSSSWSEYYAEFKAPVLAAFMKMTFYWESPKREGAADGIVFFDDAALELLPTTTEPSAVSPETKSGSPNAAVPLAPATPPRKPSLIDR